MLMSIISSQSATRRSSRGDTGMKSALLMRTSTGRTGHTRKVCHPEAGTARRGTSQSSVAATLAKERDDLSITVSAPLPRRIGDLAARSRDPTSESLQPIQSARAEYDLCAACLPRAKFYVASPIPLLAPVMTTTSSLIPCMKFCFPVSPIQRLRR
jgi:hypothetical protein